MPTVVDSLVLQLGIDKRQFTEGIREVMDSYRKGAQGAEKFGKGIEHEGAKLNDIFASVKRGALGIVGAFVGGEIAGAIDNVGRLDNRTAQFAKTIGLAIPNLSKWEGMIKLIGGAGGEATAALNGLQEAFNQHSAGVAVLPGPAQSLFNNIGGWVDAKTGRQKPVTQIMEELAAWGQREIAAGRLSGPEFSGRLSHVPGMNQMMKNLIFEGIDGMNKLGEAATKLGLASKKSAEDSKEYVAAVEGITLKWQDFAREALPGVASVLDSLTDRLKKLKDEGPFKALGLPTPNESGSVGFKDVANSFKDVVDGIKDWWTRTAPEVTPGGGRWWTRLTPEANPGGPALPVGAAPAGGAFGGLPYTVPTQAAPARAAGGVPGPAGATVPNWAAGVLWTAPTPAAAAAGPQALPYGPSLPKDQSRVGAPAAANLRSSTSNETSNSTTTVQIDNISVILPNATDGESVAAGLGPALRNVTLAGKANYAMTG